MTVSELHDQLSIFIERGQGNLNVIADCSFTINGEEYSDFHIMNLDDVYYQSGDIELEFNSENLVLTNQLKPKKESC